MPPRAFVSNAKAKHGTKPAISSALTTHLSPSAYPRSPELGGGRRARRRGRKRRGEVWRGDDYGVAVPGGRAEGQGGAALVTGGGSGICFEITTQLARHGAHVAIMGRRREVLDKAVAALRSHGLRIAAFIAEPVMSAGGVLPPTRAYFEVQAVVETYLILFIADEVITAFGRLGTMFGSDKYNIKPDLVSLAKALSSAYVPIGATLVSREISDVIHSQSNKLGSFAHGFTYSAIQLLVLSP